VARQDLGASKASRATVRERSVGGEMMQVQNKSNIKYLIGNINTLSADRLRA